MDQVIVQAVKAEVELDDELKGFIESKRQGLNLREILANPKAALAIFAEDLAQAAIKKFSTRYILQGVQFAEGVQAKKKGVDLSGKVPEAATEVVA